MFSLTKHIMHFTKDERKEKCMLEEYKYSLQREKPFVVVALTFFLWEVNKSKARKRKGVILPYSHQEIIHIEETKGPITLL